MTKEKFLEDLQKVYDFLNDEKAKVNLLIKHLENKEFDKLELINDFAKALNLSMSDDLKFALVTRLVNLDRRSTRLNSSHLKLYRMPSSA